MVKSPQAFRTISEVSGALDVPAHVLRFWETKFSQVKPVKRGGGRRYYRPEDVKLLTGIRELLYVDGLTIKGVQKVLRERGPRAVADRAAGPTPDAPQVTEAPARSPGAQPPETAAPVPSAAPAPPDCAPETKSALPRGAAPAPAGEDAALRAAVSAAALRLEALQTRLSRDPSEGMELIQSEPAEEPAEPPAGARARRAGRA